MWRGVCKTDRHFRLMCPVRLCWREVTSLVCHVWLALAMFCVAIKVFPISLCGQTWEPGREATKHPALNTIVMSWLLYTDSVLDFDRTSWIFISLNSIVEVTEVVLVMAQWHVCPTAWNMTTMKFLNMQACHETSGYVLTEIRATMTYQAILKCWCVSLTTGWFVCYAFWILFTLKRMWHEKLLLLLFLCQRHETCMQYSIIISKQRLTWSPSTTEVYWGMKTPFFLLIIGKWG